MTTLRLQVDDEVVFEGPATVIPRAGESVRLGDDTLRVEYLIWDADTAAGITAVTVVATSQPLRY